MFVVDNHIVVRRLCTVSCLLLQLVSCRSSGRRGDNSVRSSQASYILTASALARAYADDPAAADTKYKDKVIGLTGGVDDVESDLAGGYTLNLQAGTEWYDVITCKFPKGPANDLLKLTRGSYVRIKGRCSGKSPVLMLVDCILIDEKGAPLGDESDPTR